MSLEKTVIDNIKRIRKEKNISQEKLAEYCETSTSYIGLMETYKNIPKLSTIEKIASALNIEAQVLFQKEESDVPDEEIMRKAQSRKKIKAEIMQKFEAEIDTILSRL